MNIYFQELYLKLIRNIDINFTITDLYRDFFKN